MRSLGILLDEYKRRTSEMGVTFLHLPCVEMAPFEDPEQVWEACRVVEEQLVQDVRCRVVVHCRGGVGRAGTFAACYLLHRMHEFSRELGALQNGRAYGPRDAIAHVRKRRCPRALESRKQEDFVDVYAKLLEAKSPQNYYVPEHSPSPWRPINYESNYLDPTCLDPALGAAALDLVACAE